jgi:choline dehydrogenase-like flavoprotein
MTYDVIIIGSGAGGSAAAYQLTQSGKKVLVVEKGQPLPRDGSILDVGKSRQAQPSMMSHGSRHGESLCGRW